MANPIKTLCIQRGIPHRKRSAPAVSGCPVHHVVVVQDRMADPAQALQ